jgi:hypothetical protein
MHIDPQSKHGWQALRYAARHLTDAEQREFENRLGEDQAARDAVAQAVELAHTATFLHLESETELSDLTAALRAAPARSTLDAALQAAAPAEAAAPQRPAASTWTAKAGWWSAAAAACVALVALWSANKNPPLPVPNSQQASNEQVATAVTNAWANLNTDSLSSFQPADDVTAENLTSVRELSRDSEEALSMDWLLNGLRQDGMAPVDRLPEIERTN